jgi:hypothetical protein
MGKKIMLTEDELVKLISNIVTENETNEMFGFLRNMVKPGIKAIKTAPRNVDFKMLKNIDSSTSTLLKKYGAFKWTQPLKNYLRPVGEHMTVLKNDADRLLKSLGTKNPNIFDSPIYRDVKNISLDADKLAKNMDESVTKHFSFENTLSDLNNLTFRLNGLKATKLPTPMKNQVDMMLSTASNMEKEIKNSLSKIATH